MPPFNFTWGPDEGACSSFALWVLGQQKEKAFECVYFPKKQRRTSYRDDGLLQGRSGNWDDQEFSQSALRLIEIIDVV